MSKLTLPTISYWKPKSFFEKHQQCHICKRMGSYTKSDEMLILTHNAVKHYFGVCNLHKMGINLLIRNHKLAEPKVFMVELSKLLGLALYYDDVVYDSDLLQPKSAKVTYVIPEYTNQ